MPLKKRSKYKVAVVGTINRDTIYRPKAEKIESYGGILYNLKYLCQKNSFEIYPIVNIGYDCYRPVMSILTSFRNIDLAYAKGVKQKNNHCFLHYTDQSNKRELLVGGVPPLTYRNLQPVLDFDLMLINFIAGNDVKLAALERFRREYSGIMYMDIHSLTLGGRKAKGGIRRYLRRPRYWQRYVDCADIIQFNSVEFEMMAGVPFSPTDALDFFAAHLKKTRCLIITLGGKGSFVIYKRAKFVSRLVTSPRRRRVYDTTGCGDVFAAGFIAEFLDSHSYIKSVACGNLLAADRCRIKGAVF